MKPYKKLRPTPSLSIRPPEFEATVVHALQLTSPLRDQPEKRIKTVEALLKRYL
ncbi:hypothetical protein [Rudanella paleaurantiibacter]|uniref:hypothetical protein n=1 Tax=Rudanella paleaurantiibacter TaxID=2614655 RepID=UPI00162546EF|nr:hypothetical protein [Rudanella paleaurantiibacter]